MSTAIASQPTTNGLWAELMAKVLGATVPNFNPSQGQVFSMGSTALVSDTTDQDGAIALGFWYQLGNTIPSWSPNYAPYSDVLTGYSLFLNSIDLGGDANPNLQRQLAAAMAAQATAQSNFNSTQTAAVAQFQTYKTINPGSTLTFNQWAAQFYPTYQTSSDNLTAATNNVNSIQSQINGPGYLVISQAKAKVSALTGAASVTTSNSPYNMPVTLAGLAQYAPTYMGWDALNLAYTGPWTNTSTHVPYAPAVTLTLSGDTSSNSWEQSGWSAAGSATFFDDFLSFSVTGSASGHSFQADTSSSSFSVSLSFSALQAFAIAPGQWYEPATVATYCDRLLPNSPTYFGQNGSFAMLPTEVIFGFEPSIQITLSSNDYQSYKSQFRQTGSTSVSFGPFTLGGLTESSSREAGTINFDDSSCTITVARQPSTEPVMVGVVSTVLGNPS